MNHGNERAHQQAYPYYKPPKVLVYHYDKAHNIPPWEVTRQRDLSSNQVPSLQAKERLRPLAPFPSHTTRGIVDDTSKVAPDKEILSGTPIL